MKHKRQLFKAVCVALLLTAQSCGRASAPPPTQREGALFKSNDRGLTWQQKTLVTSADGNQGTGAAVNLKELFLDPQDDSTLYAMGKEGVWLSIDDGESWKNIAERSADALGIDPQTRGTLYLASGQKIYKTTDVGQNWVEVYRETRANVSITDVIVDPVVSSMVWMGTTAGDVVLSEDEGYSWEVVQNLGNSVAQIAPSAFERGVVFAGTESKGIFRSRDRGVTWENLLQYYKKRDEGVDSKGKPVQKDRKDVEKFVRLVLDPTRSSRVYYLSRFGMLRSNDGGTAWEEVPLLTAPGTVALFDLQINARDGNELFYASEKVLYHSDDFGAQWSTISIPTARRVITLLVNPVDPTRVYIGTDTPPPSQKKNRRLFNF